MKGRVVIVGAGLAGLACAIELSRSGFQPLVLERRDAPGGRVASDRVDGFLLDRGFQVLLDSYPQAQRLGVLPELSLRAFEPGALVRHGGRFHRVVDPWRRPVAGLLSALSPIGSLRDKLAVARWRARAVRSEGRPPETDSDVTARQHLERLGFGPSMIERFFRPFFGGVLLDEDLTVSSRMLEFLFPLFARGSACLPRDGMAALPRALAARLPAETLRLGEGAARLDGSGVTLESGERLGADAVVVATDETSSRSLLGLSSGHAATASWNSATCLSFSAEEDPVGRPALVLDGEGRGPVLNLCVPSRVSPSYAPEGRHLISAALPGNPPGTDDELLRAALAQLRLWFGAQVDEWTHLRTDRIRHALPKCPPGSLTPWRRPVRRGERLFACGDWLDNPSIDGALASGHRAARAVAETLAPGAAS
jgi:phytoene dehydrogenase-like protein